MKLLHKLILLGLGGALVAPMYIKGPNGSPLMSINDWIPQDAASLVGKVSDLKSGLQDKMQEAEGSGKEIFYKWKDENGVWQMTQYKPAHLAEADIEERVIYANANIIKSLDSSEIASALSAPLQEGKKFSYKPKSKSSEATNEVADLIETNADDLEGGLVTTVPITKIPQMINDAKNIDTVMQNRMKTIDQSTR